MRSERRFARVERNEGDSAMTNDGAKKDEHVEEYLRLRQIWAKYVDGLVERAGAVDVVPWGDVDNDETILAYESKGYGIAPVTYADDIEDKDQVEFSIRSRSSVTGRKIDVWFVAMKVGRDS